MGTINDRSEQMFPMLSPAQFEVALGFASGSPRQFRPGAVVSSIGARSAPIWLILEGSIVIVRRDGLGHEQPVRTLVAGQFTGEVSQLAGGAAIANRESGRFCVAMLGDGDYVMSAGALWSAVHYQAPLLMVINNNTTWGNDEKHQLEVAAERGRPQENAWIGQRMAGPTPDYAAIARGYGGWGEGPVTDPADLAAVFKRAVAEVERGNVALVDVRTALK